MFAHSLGRWLLLAALIGMSACGKKSTSGQQSGDESSKAEDELKNLAEVLQLMAHDGKAPPARLKDLQDATAASDGITAISQGRIIMKWRAGLKTGSNAILAYEANAPQQGGFVLLQDGTVKKLTAAEFSSAPMVP